MISNRKKMSTHDQCLEYYKLSYNFILYVLEYKIRLANFGRITADLNTEKNNLKSNKITYHGLIIIWSSYILATQTYDKHK